MTRSFRSRIIVLALAVALWTPALAQADSHAGMNAEVMVSDSVEATGKVAAINPESRLVVIEGQAGQEVFLWVPQDAPNFDQIKVGDTVLARYTESVAVAITPVTDAEPGVTEVAAVVGAAPGDTPAAVAAEAMQLRAVVAAVDAEARTVTLDVPAGGQRILKVQDGLDIDAVKVGEQVSITLSRALALSLEPK